ncbi:G-protein coupled receptor family C group 6 member A-like [Cheilinus undulatus]|uniref:G-protein coupled receptor family C group 6 member A-like n=1 Tax=Cheilinus undulatus TaxID=241271 RepID=UPI001BD4B3C5|nr:G-protein coupled receptor family C group 6 member A-like [Cheilinus undulatus]
MNPPVLIERGEHETQGPNPESTERGESNFLHAFSPGDVIIGGLFPFHRQTNRETTHGPSLCREIDIGSFLHSQVMIYAISEINQRTPRILPNVTLGYDIYDSCGDVSIAILSMLQLLKGHSDLQECLVPANFQPALPDPKTKVVIGERHSEVSIAVARVVALASVTQISYASTSELLSRKLKFPTFLRTISSDKHQTLAIAKLVEKFNWETVAIVGSDDEYGKYGCDNLLDIFRKDEDICIEFIEILPGDFYKTHTGLADLMENINKSSAEAVILFTKESNVDVIMKAAIECQLNRTWIASDSWSTSTHIAALPGIEMAGQVFGFISKRNEVPGFKDYVLSKFNKTMNPFLSHFLSQYPLCSNQLEESGEKNCSILNDQQGSKQCLDLGCLVNYIDQDQSYNIYLAVQVIAEGLRRLLKCDNQRCERSTNFTAQELLLEIRNVSLTVNTTHINFDSSGDPSLGYDIVYWVMTNPQIETIGEYWPNKTIKVPEDLVGKMSSLLTTAYNCSKTCPPGQELKILQKKCCKYCIPCAEGEFSAGNGDKCGRCNEFEFSSQNKDCCVDKKKEYLYWSNHFVVILSCLAVLGIIVVIVFAVLFKIYCCTPIVKAVGGYLCFLELVALLACFCLTFTFTGQPTEASCRLGMPLFGISCSLCIACILANLLQILLGFNFNAKLGTWIKRLNKPAAIVTVVCGIQVALCVPWLYFYPPEIVDHKSPQTILLQCTKGSKPFFFAMLSYNAALAFICFLFAFKSKQLPDLYKNASLISISMMLFLIIWILFIPIYISKSGKYKRAIESAAILVFSYSILGFHLAPKCYIMLFRKEINNERAITEYIRKHFEQKNIAVVKS